jgi:hypothetical protein
LPLYAVGGASLNTNVCANHGHKLFLLGKSGQVGYAKASGNSSLAVPAEFDSGPAEHGG